MDIAVLDAIQQHLRTPLLDQIMLLATHLGDLALVWLVAGAVLVAQPLPYPGRGVTLLAPIAAVLGQPLLDQGQVRIDHRTAPFPDGRLLGPVVHPEVLAHRGLAHVLLARYRRYGFAVPSHTADRLYLGHADHLPFRPFLVEIRSTIQLRPAGGRHALCLNPKKFRD